MLTKSRDDTVRWPVPFRPNYDPNMLKSACKYLLTAESTEGQLGMNLGPCNCKASILPLSYATSSCHVCTKSWFMVWYLYSCKMYPAKCIHVQNQHSTAKYNRATNSNWNEIMVA